MRFIKKIFGSLYVRFLTAFIGAFIFSMLIAALFINITQFGNVQKMVNTTLDSKVSQIKALVDNENMSVNKAIYYLSNAEVSEKAYDTIMKTGILFSEKEIQNVENGNVVKKINYSGKLNLAAVFKLDNRYILITPNIENNPMTLFLSMQRIGILIPIILGTFLIFFATITVVKPIKRISEASKKVASGDFNVQLPVKGDTEISDLIRNFNLMIKELSASEYLHKDFVSNVSHEFKTPITSIKGYARLLKDNNLPEEKRQEYADIIISESDRLSKLSSNLLKLSELENESIGIKKETFSLDEQIRDVVLLLQNEWEKKNIEIDLDLDDVSFTGDKQLMYQVWVNLISNSVKYSNQNGLLQITLKQSKRIMVEIIDNGIGIPADELDKIFLRFYKIDQTRNSSGTGLGLSIVKRIIELHGGSVTPVSEIGKGSKFIVEL